MNLAVVGAGSTYTPELVDGLISVAASLRLERLARTSPKGRAVRSTIPASSSRRRRADPPAS